MNSKESYNFIKSTFLKLTQKTYPYGYEDELVHQMTKIGIFNNLQKDKYGNYFIKIGESRTVFASHLDTVSKSQVKVNHRIDNNIIRTDKTTILGADDKAGVTVLLYMIKHNIPGLYYFFIGEEVGCIGSGLASSTYETKGHYDRMISFDRRGTNSIITHQSGTRTCSDAFAKELALQLNKYRLSYKSDNTGVYTDSAEFVHSIPECTNISVGYYQEHTFNEHQDINHLYKLAESCLQVDWESLPTCRDINKVESKWNSYTQFDDDDDSGWDTSWNSQGYKPWPSANGQSNSSWEDNPNAFSSRKKRKRKKSKTYFSNGGELDYLYDSTNLNNSKYEIVKDSFFTTALSSEELEIVKEQYLDMSNPDDRDVYQILLESYPF